MRPTRNGDRQRRIERDEAPRSRTVRRARRDSPPAFARPTTAPAPTSAPRRTALRIAAVAGTLAALAVAIAMLPRGSSATTGACPHPFVPSRVGTRLRYAWSTGSAQGELVLALTGAARRGGGVDLAWESSMSGAGATITGTIVRPCSDAAACEPWFAFPQPGGVEIDAPSWSWPAELSPGATFGGVFTVRGGGRERAIERRHRVIGRETVHVPAGGFDAVRVEIADVGERDGSRGRGTLWVAEGIGLVRSDESSAGGEAHYELVEASIPRTSQESR